MTRTLSEKLALSILAPRWGRGYLAAPSGRRRRAPYGPPQRCRLYCGDRRRRGGSLAQGRRRAGVRCLIDCLSTKPESEANVAGSQGVMPRADEFCSVVFDNVDPDRGAPV